MKWIPSRRGTQINFEAPTPEMFTVGEIASGLSREGRFANQSTRHISVAEHSVNVSLLVPEHLAIVALLHDASEAYTRDIPSPLKTLCPGFRVIEERMQNIIYQKFAFIPEGEDMRALDLADLQCLKVEGAKFITGPLYDQAAIDLIPDPEGIEVMGYDSRNAELRFMQRAYKIGLLVRGEA